MRTAVLVLIASLFLAACGNEEELAAKQQELKGLRDKMKALNAEKASKGPGWVTIKNAVIPARSALIGAKRRDDEAATASAQEAFDAAQEAANAVIAEENALNGEIRDLQDEITKVEKAVLKLGGRP